MISVNSILHLIILMTAITTVLWLGQSRIVVVEGLDAKRVYENKVKRLLLNLILLIIFIVYFAFRRIDDEYGGVDAIVYKNRFLNATGGLINGIKSQDNEIGYALLVYFVRLFTDNFAVFQVIYYLIFLLLLANINKEIVRTPISFFLTWIFITLNIFLSLCLMRNMLACLLAYNAIVYFSKKQKLKTVIFCVLAIFCHYSTVIIIYGFLIYALYKKKNITSRKMAVILIANVLLILIFGRYAILLLSESKYSGYITTEANIGFGIEARLGLMCIAVLLMRNKEEKNLTMKNNQVQVQAMSAVFALQCFFPIAYRMFLASQYSQLQVWNELYCNVKTGRVTLYRTILFLGCLAAVIVELYLFFANTVTAYGLFPIIGANT